MGVDFPLHPGVLVPDNAREDVLSLALENALEARPAAQLPGNLLWWHHIEGWRRRVGYAWQPANV